ncbi:MAG TPA: carboxypeptidase regulatory-like domain-containing protein [Bryobacteraceae bacterium]|nr:carboxypeptidase regulatory-like domain-containing protein [Bryobacteraceae bacterium]
MTPHVDGGTRVSALLRSFTGGLATLLVLVAVFLTATLFAQERFGEINGTAMDATGAVLPNATVTLTHRDTNKVYTSKTNNDGAYIVRDLDPGHYRVRVDATGFTSYEVPDVNVQAGRVLRVDANMQVGGTQQSVQVTEAAPLIDVTTTGVSHNVNAEEFNRMPKSRTFQSLAITSPNVNVGDVEGGIQVNGASGAENNFIVDGISTNSLIEGQSRQNAAFEILEEVQVKTAGIEAQYGGATGGVISAITRTGGNSFHGDLHYYYYGNKINAGPVKRLFMDPVNLTTVTYEQDHKNPNNNNEFGYALGGRIIKDKLFFFSAATPRFQNREATYLTSDQQRVTLKQDARYWQAYNKISWDPFTKLRTNFGWLWSPSNTAGTLVGYSGTGNYTTGTAASLLPNQVRGSFSPQSNYSGNIDFAPTATSLLSFRGAYFYDNYKSIGVPGVSAVEWGKPSTGLSFVPANLQFAQGYQTTPRVQSTDHDLATRTMLQLDFSKYLTFAGSHDFKMGLGRLKNVNNVNNSYPGGGYVTLFWDSAYEDPITKKQDRGAYGYYTIDDIGTKGSTGGTIDNMFFQDRWRVMRRLSLDLGVRLEREEVPSFRRDIQPYAFRFGWGQKIAPRLGASFDVFGDGRLKVYGSYGVFYDWIKYELSRGTFGGDVWTTRYRSLDTLDVLTLSGTNTPGRNLWARGTAEDHRIPSFGKNTLDPGLNPFSSDLTNFGVEYQVNPRSVAAIRYTHNHLREAIDDIGTLDDAGSEVYVYGNPGKGITTRSSPSNKVVKSFELPRPVRLYDAVEFSFNRRFANRWFGNFSYVWSRLYGNYSGIASSDEITPPGTGRSSLASQTNVGQVFRPGTAASRYYDLDYLLYDSKGGFDPQGPLPTDRPHVFKAYGSYQFPFGTQVGGFFFGGSGTPMSTYVNTVQNAPVFANGRADMPRTPFLTQTDLSLSHEIKMGEVRRLHFEFNAQNVFNQKTSRFTYNYLNRYRTRTSGINLASLDFTKGYDYKALIAASADAKQAYTAYDPRYGKQDLFNTGFAGRFGLKFIF